MDWLVEIFDQIKEAFILSVDSLNSFYNNIESQTDTLISMTDNIQNGTMEGLNIVQFIGTFRYIVGDPIWYVFYSLTMLGLGYTIYAIVVLIKNEIPVSSIVGNIKGLFLK
ncbi:hypothetical protein [Sporosalibacterium faouarense]|uniref:hypothetical protein n=1 Tax=Sporosalibacterium faouarense TaxID=516123 RepID=UPI00192AEAA7|nr:hypothetical protein [Sporosalibacterium faouarense]